MHISYEEAQALIYAAEGNTTDVKKAVLDNLVKYGYLKKEGETYIPTFLIMRKRKNKIRTSEQEAEYNRLLNRAVKIGFSHYAFCRGIVCSEIPDFFKDDQYQIDHACANIYDIRGAVLEEALRKGYISYSENDARKMLGAYLII